MEAGIVFGLGRSGVRHSAPAWVPLAATERRMSRTKTTSTTATAADNPKDVEERER